MNYTARRSADLDELWPMVAAAERHSACSAFQSEFWLKAWLDHFAGPENGKPFYVEVRDETGAVVFALPLIISRTMGLLVIEGLDRGLSDYVAPILPTGEIDETRRADVMAAFMKALPPADVLSLRKIPLTIGPHRVRNPLVAAQAEKMGYSSHSIELGDDWDTFFARRTSTSSRATRRRKLRKLAERGQVEFVVLTDVERRLEALSFMVRERARRASDQGWATNVLADEGALAFCRLLVTAPDLVRKVHVAAVQVSGEMIAVHVGFVHCGELIWYLPTFQSGEWGAFSPGQLLLDMELKWAIENGLSSFDLTIGDERYKQEWKPSTVPLFEIRTGLSFLGTTALGMRSAARRMGSALRGAVFPGRTGERTSTGA